MKLEAPALASVPGSYGGCDPATHVAQRWQRGEHGFLLLLDDEMRRQVEEMADAGPGRWEGTAERRAGRAVRRGW